PQVDQPLVTRKLSPDPEGVVAQPSAHDVLTRGPRQVELDVREELAFAPVGESTDARRDPGELGDEGIAHPDGRGEMPDQGLEKELSCTPGRSLHDRAEGNDLVGDEGA